MNEDYNYSDILWNFFEPFMERSKEPLERSRIAAEEYRKGKVKSINDV